MCGGGGGGGGEYRHSIRFTCDMNERSESAREQRK